MIRSVLFWTLILCACSPILPSTQASPQTLPPPATQTPTAESMVTEVFPDSPALPIPKFAETLQTPRIDQPPDGTITTAPPNPQDCGYQWANQDLPELSRIFQDSIQTIQPGAQATAFGFGENCVHTDGSTTFLPMETDFKVTLQVLDLTDQADLGGWIVKTMQVIDHLPPDQIVGSQPGRVTITFELNGQQQWINFYVDRYHALATGLRYEEIYQILQVPQ